jgi:hypothetical protein
VGFILRWSAFNGFVVWFWYQGIHLPNPNQCKEPSVFFANVGAYGWISTFSKVGVIVGILVCVFLLYKLVENFLERLSAQNTDAGYDRRWAWRGNASPSLGEAVFSI